MRMCFMDDIHLQPQYERPGLWRRTADGQSEFSITFF